MAIEVRKDQTSHDSIIALIDRDDRQPLLNHIQERLAEIFAVFFQTDTKRFVQCTVFNKHARRQIKCLSRMQQGKRDKVQGHSSA